MCHFVLNAAVIAEAVKPRSAFTLEYESLVSKKKKKKKKKKTKISKSLLVLTTGPWSLVSQAPSHTGRACLQTEFEW
jgi:hypothetical protein